MNFSKPRAILAIALFALMLFAVSLAACSGGASPQVSSVGHSQPNGAAPGAAALSVAASPTPRRCGDEGQGRCIRLPVVSGTNQTLANNGPLGAIVNYQASNNNGFFDWQTIGGAPKGIALLLFGNHPIESIVVASTLNNSLSSITVTGVFATGGSVTNLDGLSTTSSSGGTGEFVPDPNPTLLGPFLATVNGNQTSFTVVPDVSPSPGFASSATTGLQLGGKRAWNFSLDSVTVCVPVSPTTPCNDGTSTNNQTALPINTAFSVLVSDSSGLLKNAYTLTATGPCTVSTTEETGSPPPVDAPPGYNDSSSETGPNVEFEGLAGATSGTCVLTASYNGKQVGQTSVAIFSGGSRPIPYTLRPPVNGPSGFGVSGHIH